MPQTATNMQNYFYPRSPCGERLPRYLTESVSQYFYPRSPCGERRGCCCLRDGRNKFLSTLSLRRATLRILYAFFLVVISIHALLAESDTAKGYDLYLVEAFLSTLSLRRATTSASSACRRRRYFYPRSPCGERPLLRFLRFGNSLLFLSTLSLRRATLLRASAHLHTLHFYPRSPCGERPKTPASSTSWYTISIHALLAESDRAFLFGFQILS